MAPQLSRTTASACGYQDVDTPQLQKQQRTGAELDRLDCSSSRSLPQITPITTGTGEADSPEPEREHVAVSYALRKRATSTHNHCRYKGRQVIKMLLIQLRTEPPRPGASEPGWRPSVQRPAPLQPTDDAYILGPGDGLQIELLDLPELSGRFSIGPDGTLYLPRLRALDVESLTVQELRYFLTQQFSTDVRDRQVYVRPVVYRPIRINVGGKPATAAIEQQAHQLLNSSSTC